MIATATASDTGAIVRSVSIENMIRQRAAVLDRIGSAVGLLLEAQQIADSANIGFPTIALTSDMTRIECRLTGKYRGDDADHFTSAAREAIDVGGWTYLMSESGMRSLMDAKARADWDKGLQDKKIPPLTEENIKSTFRQLHDSRGEMFERGVLTVFKSLSWDYKTNKPFAFGKRIIIRFLTDHIMGGRGDKLGYLNHRQSDELDDLTRVLSILDGKPEPDHRNGSYHWLSDGAKTPEHVGSNDYLEVKMHRNGNGHVLFKRPDLVAKMNAILAKHYPGALAHDHHQGQDS